ncbi:GrpB family protein [Glutamicibacter sp. MNS18]|uniref:GrpB family protein n=1 Tax=Glutamicibacter sp. MNS18 TaxID=2989817 RepID=UPI002236A550|nr:GrpB family protein [Glutamicibacter sp. MNS18]MCW4467061.1 GrpB family protein [Glutamicibacter sp. MNS18]
MSAGNPERSRVRAEVAYPPAPALLACLESGDLGLRRGTVRLVPDSPRWVQVFTRLAEIPPSTAPRPVAIEHIGSTSVSGLPAKPTLDIAIGLMHPADAPTVHDWLLRQGFPTAVREACSRLEHLLAVRNPDDSRAYSVGKGAFIRR